MSKVLVYDIETTPNLAYVWGKYQQDVIAYQDEWKLLSFAYKWLGEKKTYAIGTNEVDERALVLQIHELFTQADVVIAHNGDKFDQKKVNAKFLEFGLTPPSPYKSVDTLKVAKRYFKLNSNKLDDIGNILGVGRKVQTGGFSLWLGCIENDPKAWTKMLRYNKQDVVLLEKIYLKLRPWMDNHPPLNSIDNNPTACPKCLSTKLKPRGYSYTKVTMRPRYRCDGCGGWCSGRLTRRTEVQFVN